MESNEIHRILWNPMKSIESYGIQMKSIEIHRILWNGILNDFVFIDTDFDACRDYRRHLTGSPGAPREPSDAILQ